MDRLPVDSPIDGFFWTWVLPIVIFSIAFAATWLLYRHFAKEKED
ncbi:MAG: hypothetical protein ACI9UK_001027 [Candidatus Krumholzibacteriia bacterium]|jgi:hypothetical protein